MRLLGDRVLIKNDPAPTHTEGGMYIPLNARKAPNSGIVVALGPGLKGNKINLEVGQHVGYNEFAGSDLMIDDEPHLLMREEDILYRY